MSPCTRTILQEVVTTASLNQQLMAIPSQSDPLYLEWVQLVFRANSVSILDPITLHYLHQNGPVTSKYQFDTTNNAAWILWTQSAHRQPKSMSGDEFYVNYYRIDRTVAVAVCKRPTQWKLSPHFLSCTNIDSN